MLTVNNFSPISASIPSIGNKWDKLSPQHKKIVTVVVAIFAVITWATTLYKLYTFIKVGPAPVAGKILAAVIPKANVKRIDWKGGTYIGEVEENRPHGQGKFIYYDGAINEGKFVYGNFIEGKSYSNGITYEGIFLDGLNLTGKGKKILATGEVYEGYFKGHSAMEGEGKKILANGDVYVGTFDHDKLHGKGKITFANGDIYEGNFRRDKLNGKGKKTLANRDIHEGNFDNDKLYGEGKKTLANGVVQDGNFKDGKLETGKLILASEVTYEGEFGYGLFRGTKTLANGDVMKNVFLNEELLDTDKS